MNTILTDDEIDAAGRECFWPLDEDAPKFARAIESAVLAKLAAREPLFLLHSGRIGSDGEQDEWETEADSGRRVDDFCRKHPGQTIALYPFTAPLPAVVQVPQGWKLVPVEPTRAMLDAYVNSNQLFHSAISDWKVMLATAPEAPAQPIPPQWREAMKVAREALHDLVPMVEAMLMIHGTPEPGSVGHKARAAIAQLDALGGVE